MKAKKVEYKLKDLCTDIIKGTIKIDSLNSSKPRYTLNIMGVSSNE